MQLFKNSDAVSKTIHFNSIALYFSYTEYHMSWIYLSDLEGIPPIESADLARIFMLISELISANRSKYSALNETDYIQTALLESIAVGNCVDFQELHPSPMASEQFLAACEELSVILKDIPSIPGEIFNYRGCPMTFFDTPTERLNDELKKVIGILQENG